MAEEEQRSASIRSTSPYHQKCFPPFCDNALYIDKQAIGKLDRDELEDKYIIYADENLALKRRMRDHERQIQRLQTAVARQDNINKKAGVTPASVTCDQSRMDSLESQNKYFQSKIKVLKQQLLNHSYIHSKEHRINENKDKQRREREHSSPEPSFRDIGQTQSAREPKHRPMKDPLTARDNSSTLKERVSELERMLEAQRNKYKSRIAQLEKQIASQSAKDEEKELTETTRKVSENMEMIRLQRMSQQLSQDLENMTDQYQAVDSELVKIKAALNQANERIEEMEKQLEREREKAMEAQSNLTKNLGHAETIKVLEEQVRDLENERKTLRETNEQLLQLTSGTQSRTDTVKSQTDDKSISSSHRKLLQENENLQEELQTVRGQLENENAELMVKFNVALQEIEELKNGAALTTTSSSHRNLEKEEEKEDLQQELLSVRDQHEKEKTELEAKLNAALQEIEELKEGAQNNNSSSHRNLAKEKEDLLAERSQLEQENAELVEKLDAALKKMNELGGDNKSLAGSSKKVVFAENTTKELEQQLNAALAELDVLRPIATEHERCRYTEVVQTVLSSSTNPGTTVTHTTVVTPVKTPSVQVMENKKKRRWPDARRVLALVDKPESDPSGKKFFNVHEHTSVASDIEEEKEFEKSLDLNLPEDYSERLPSLTPSLDNVKKLLLNRRAVLKTKMAVTSESPVSPLQETSEAENSAVSLKSRGTKSVKSDPKSETSSHQPEVNITESATDLENSAVSLKSGGTKSVKSDPKSETSSHKPEANITESATDLENSAVSLKSGGTKSVKSDPKSETSSHKPEANITESATDLENSAVSLKSGGTKSVKSDPKSETSSHKPEANITESATDLETEAVSVSPRLEVTDISKPEYFSTKSETHVVESNHNVDPWKYSIEIRNLNYSQPEVVISGSEEDLNPQSDRKISNVWKKAIVKYEPKEDTLRVFLVKEEDEELNAPSEKSFPKVPSRATTKSTVQSQQSEEHEQKSLHSAHPEKSHQTVSSKGTTSPMEQSKTADNVSESGYSSHEQVITDPAQKPVLIIVSKHEFDAVLMKKRKYYSETEVALPVPPGQTELLSCRLEVCVYDLEVDDHLLDNLSQLERDPQVFVMWTFLGLEQRTVSMPASQAHFHTNVAYFGPLTEDVAQQIDQSEMMLRLMLDRKGDKAPLEIGAGRLLIIPAIQKPGHGFLRCVELEGSQGSGTVYCSFRLLECCKSSPQPPDCLDVGIGHLHLKHCDIPAHTHAPHLYVEYSLLGHCGTELETDSRPKGETVRFNHTKRIFVTDENRVHLEAMLEEENPRSIRFMLLSEPCNLVGGTEVEEIGHADLNLVEEMLYKNQDIVSTQLPVFSSDGEELGSLSVTVIGINTLQRYAQEKTRTEYEE